MVDRRQFAISNVRVNYRNFLCMSFGECWISYDKHLRIQSQKDISGVEWLLIGAAFSAEKEGSSPLQDIANSKTEDVIKKTFYWAGRWVLMNKKALYTDATGLMGLYYTKVDGRWIISTSLHILYELNPERYGVIERKVKVHDQFHSYPAPGSILKGVRKLFPSQYIQYDHKTLSFYYCEKYHLQRDVSAEEKNVLLANAIHSIISNVASQSGKNVYVALTSGNDSRVLLAALLESKVKFTGYTMEHGNISKGDRQIPEKMSKELNFPYTYIKKKKKAQCAAYDRFYTHTFYTLDETDREFYACGQFDDFDKNCLILKGGILDLCKGSAYRKFSADNELQKYLKMVSPDTVEYQKYNALLEEWFQWKRQHVSELDIRDQFTLEYHLGGWLANLQQFADMLDAEYVQICNCAYIISLICSYTDEERESREIYKTLYQMLYPEVGNYPVNPYDRYRLVKYYWNIVKKNPIMAFRKIFKR